MAVCQMCGKDFFYADQGGPAEDCECGQNATKEHMRERRDELVDSGSSDDPRDGLVDETEWQ